MENWRNYVDEPEQDEELLEEGLWGFLKGGVLGTLVGGLKGAAAGVGVGGAVGAGAGAAASIPTAGLGAGPAGAIGAGVGGLAGTAIGAPIGGLTGAWEGAFGDEESEEETPEESGDKMGVLLDIIGVVGDLAGAAFPPLIGVAMTADMVNGVRYITRGQYFYALLSFISALPGVGDVLGKGVKYFATSYKTTNKAAMATAKASGLTGKAARQAAMATPDVAKAIDRASDAKAVYNAFQQTFGPRGKLQANKFFKFVADHSGKIEMVAKMALKQKEAGGGKLSSKDLAKLAKSDEFFQLLESIKGAAAAGQA